MRIFPLAMLLALQALCASQIRADEFIVNTGPGTRWDGASISGFTIGVGIQWLASEFFIDRPTTIVSAKGWMWGVVPGQLEIAILSGSGQTPGTVIYSESLDIGEFLPPAWTGLSGLNWYLEPGAYWISLGDMRSSLPDGSVHAAAPYPSVQPLGNEATWQPSTGWYPNDGIDIGIQIIAASADTNEPVCWETNGHCYQNISASRITWQEAKVAAQNQFFRGVQGHLATVTSSAERDFIDTAVMAPSEQVPPFGGNRGWLGGFQSADGEPFEWITGEPFVFVNWRAGEPRGDSGNNYIERNWDLTDWNDTANFDLAIDGFLVEYPASAARILCAGDVNGDGITDVAMIRPDGQTIVKRLGGALVSQFGFGDIADIVDVEIMADINTNASPELVALGTGSVKTEVRDMLTGARLSDVDFDSLPSPIDLELLTDQTGNGIPELATLGQGANSISVAVKDALTSVLLNTVRFSGYFYAKDLEMLIASDGSGTPALAVLGDNKDPAKNDKLEIRDVSTGNTVQDIWLGSGWQVLQLEWLGDLNGNGYPEAAVLRIRNDQSQYTVVLRDSGSRQWLGTLYFDPQYPPRRMLVIPDINGNGADEVVVFGQRFNGGNQKAQVMDSRSGQILRAVFYDKTFPGQDIAVCEDINGNGAEELVMLGRRASDGQLKAIVKDAKTGERLGVVNF